MQHKQKSGKNDLKMSIQLKQATTKITAIININSNNNDNLCHG